MLIIWDRIGPDCMLCYITVYIYIYICIICGDQWRMAEPCHSTAAR